MESVADVRYSLQQTLQPPDFPIPSRMAQRGGAATK
jgi:hypothetical protein